MSNTIERFCQNMQENGIQPPSSIFADGRIHRFSVNNDKKNSGWYILHDDVEFAAGSFGCWKNGIKKKWTSKHSSVMTTKEIKKFKSRMKKMQRQYKEELKRKHARCRKKAVSMWSDADKKNVGKHRYAKRKGIMPFAARTNPEGELLIPVRNVKAKIVGLQIIKRDGTKRFLPGTPKTGNFVFLGKDPEAAKKICICEGWATGCSIREATGMPVVVAFDAGNLEKVAKTWRRKLPNHKIIIAGDDDHATNGNPGMTKAKDAAVAVDGIAVFPTFKDATGKTDFNDMHQEQGLVAVKKVIRKAHQKSAWSKPILFETGEAPEIPFSVIPEPLSGYCKAVADSTQTPPALAIMTGIAAVSTCLQKRFEVSPYGDNYTEPVNIMTVVALEPGARKTAVKNAMTEPLALWEKEQSELLKEDAARVNHQRDILLKSIESIKSSVSKPDTSEEDRSNAMEEIKRLEKKIPKEIVMPKLWVDDVTTERLQGLMAENGERFAIISDEGGVFEVISGLYSGGKSNINVILQSHAGSPVRVERQGRSVMMHKPALSLGLVVQPDIISNLATGNRSRFRGIGMLARLLFCIPKSTVGSRDVTKRIPIPESSKYAYHRLIGRLLKIAPKLDEMENEVPRILTLEPEALKVWQKFSQEIESKQGKFGEYHYIQDWTGKLPGAALRIAGLCHVVEHGKKITSINKATVKRAIVLSNLLITHAKVAFGMMGSDPVITDAKVVLEWIIKNNVDKFRRGDIHRALHGRFTTLSRLMPALKILIERHVISDPQEKYTGHRPEIIYTVNPLLLKTR